MSTRPASAPAQHPDSDSRQTLSIDVVARMFGISRLMLQFLERAGLVRRERHGGAKVYSWSSCEQIALFVRARRSGLRFRDITPVIRAMNERAPEADADAGRSKCLALVNMLEIRRQSISSIMDELYRIDWELSQRLRSPSNSDPLDRAVAASPSKQPEVTI